MILRTYKLIQGVREFVLGDGPPAAFVYYDDPNSMRSKLNTNFSTIADFVETIETGLEDFSAAIFGKGIFTGMDYTTSGLTLTIQEGYALIGRLIHFPTTSIELPPNSVSTVYVGQDGSIGTTEPEVEYFEYAQVTTDSSNITNIDTSVRDPQAIIPAQIRELDGLTVASISDSSMATDIPITHSTPIVAQGYVQATITSEHSGWCEVFPIYPELWTETSFWLRVQIKSEYMPWYYYYWAGDPVWPYYPPPENISISWQRTGLAYANA